MGKKKRCRVGLLCCHNDQWNFLASRLTNTGVDLGRNIPLDLQRLRTRRTTSIKGLISIRGPISSDVDQTIERNSFAGIATRSHSWTRFGHPSGLPSGAGSFAVMFLVFSNRWIHTIVWRSSSANCKTCQSLRTQAS
jgi:hypothetical protein